jgi:hypothetical protein
MLWVKTVHRIDCSDSDNDSRWLHCLRAKAWQSTPALFRILTKLYQCQDSAIVDIHGTSA